MIHAKATCPECKETIIEKEDGWFLCEGCGKDWWWDDLIKLGIKPMYFVKLNDEHIHFLNE
jgi:hypothetical protein